MIGKEYDTIDTESQLDNESITNKSDLEKDSLSSFSLFSLYQKICWFHLPTESWSFSYYISSKGQENCHIYLWLLKDLAWVQSWYYEGIVIGGIAVLWSCFLVIKSIKYRNINDFWSRFADLLWLFANYWWMIGETHDYQFPNSKSMYEGKTRQAAYIMIISLVWIASYYFIFKPSGLITYFSSLSRSNDGRDHEPSPRFPTYFQSWREYENLHSLFWIGKDTAWVLANLPMWFIFFFPTVAVSLDVTLLTLFQPTQLIDHAHHCAQFLWVIANAVWASGELFLTTHHDEPLSLARFNSEARVTARWWSSWVVLFSFLPLIVLHLIWIPATLSGRISSITSQALSELNERQVQQNLDTSNHLSLSSSIHAIQSNKSHTERSESPIVHSPLYLDHLRSMNGVVNS